MSKAETTYLDKWNSGKARKKTSAKRSSGRKPAAGSAAARPKWIGPLIAFSLVTMLCVTVNYRAFSEMSAEAAQNEILAGEIQEATSRNIALQQEIYDLRNDTKTIGREARKIGMTKVLK